ncbi:hypothetical protein EV193_11852 [Herbihabitans rhizosphaerae]|uniref:Uncharacterized protein n=1 Tax=Herbihabitans rhizosphaerae TaxID=1872711 RepID=A0A4Q7KCY9_9PSEU|nr:hypothetical protein EV193_11852 [Herbihabitans rhizosphaerae]
MAAVLAGAPSVIHAARTGGPAAAVRYGLAATRAAGTLVPPGRPSLTRGLLAHGVISMLAGEILARTLPRRHPVAWGALAGLAMGAINVGLIGRAFPAIRDLPLGPQLADNAAFGAVFAVVVDRR